MRDALGRRLPDVIRPGLRVLFCGINPGVYSAAVGHQFARPGNRFWKALWGSGFTDRLVSPFEDRTLLARGVGITNLCARTTARAEHLDEAELRRGARTLAAKVRSSSVRVRPSCAVLKPSAIGIPYSRRRFQPTARRPRHPGPGLAAA